MLAAQAAPRLGRADVRLAAGCQPGLARRRGRHVLAARPVLPPRQPAPHRPLQRRSRAAAAAAAHTPANPALLSSSSATTRVLLARRPVIALPLPLLQPRQPTSSMLAASHLRGQRRLHTAARPLFVNAMEGDLEVEQIGAAALKQVEAKIEDAEANIKRVEAKIEDVEAQLKVAKTPEEIAYLRDDKRDLNDKEKRLLDLRHKLIDQQSKLIDMMRKERQKDVVHATFTRITAWKEGHLLADTVGNVFRYQRSQGSVDQLVQIAEKQWAARKASTMDKGRHPIGLVLAAPGAGKSRFLDETHGLLMGAVKEPELRKALAGAAVFKLTFENGTSAATSEHLDPEQQLAARMLYQLLPHEPKDFKATCDFVKENNVTVLMLLEKTAEVRGVALKDLTVLLLLDSVQEIPGGRGADSPFGLVIRAAAALGNVGGMPGQPFLIPICATTVMSGDVRGLWTSSQDRGMIDLPALNPNDIFLNKNRSPLVDIVIKDMGGHPRATEMLYETLLSYPSFVEPTTPSEGSPTCLTISAPPPPDQFSITDMMSKVASKLNNKYNFSRRSGNWNVLLRAIVARRSFAGEDESMEAVGLPGKLSDYLSRGLLSLDKDGFLVCPFIWIFAGAHKSTTLGPVVNELYTMLHKYFDGSLEARPQSKWAAFEKLLAHFWTLKTHIFQNQPVTWGELHAGATLHPDGAKELVRVWPVQTLQCHNQVLSSQPGKQLYKGEVLGLGRAADGEEVLVDKIKWKDQFPYTVIAGASSKGADVFGQVQVVASGEYVVFAISSKYTAVMRSNGDFQHEYLKACGRDNGGGSSFFMEFAPGGFCQVTLPTRCGYVGAENFAAYFGPLVARAWQILPHVLDINSASPTQLKAVRGLSVGMRKAIMKERELRPFESFADAKRRLEERNVIKRPGPQLKALAIFFPAV
eukprot:m.145460 g.145460  ORF g.145460 m.145460 type:complete len:922 (-) comp16785_c0_seq4:43-2808(-)